MAADLPARTQRQQGASGSLTTMSPSTRPAAAPPPSVRALTAGRPAASNESSATVVKPALRIPDLEAWFSGAYAIQNRPASADSSRTMASSSRG